MINDFSRDELVNNVDMTIVNRVKSPAIEPYAQCELLIETQNDIQEKGEYAEGN